MTEEKEEIYARHSREFVYAVMMHRYGCKEGHIYLMGVFADRKIAEYKAQIHIIMRAGKYSAEIRHEQIDGILGRGLVCYIDEADGDEDYLNKRIEERKKVLISRKKYLEEYKEENEKDS